MDYRDFKVDGNGFAIVGIGCMEIPDSAYRGNAALKCVEIAEGVTYIGDYAFEGCSQLQVVVIPESVKAIGKTPFVNCNFPRIIFVSAKEDFTSEMKKGVYYVYKNLAEVDMKEWSWLLSSYPTLMKFFSTLSKWNEGCVWEYGNDWDPWLDWLCKHPEFVTYFEKYRQWTSIDGFEWVYLLREQPFFCDKCDQVDGWQKINNRMVYTRDEDNEEKAIDITVEASLRWQKLLEKQPMFKYKGDEYNVWRYFDGLNWARLLMKQPQFFGVCDDNDGWVKIHQDNERAREREKEWEYRRVHSVSFGEEEYNDYDEYNSFWWRDSGGLFKKENGVCMEERGWRGILKESPYFLDMNIEVLSNKFLLYFLMDEPRLAALHYERLNLWRRLTKDDWEEIEKSNNNWLEYVSRGIGPGFWNALTKVYPNCIDDVLNARPITEFCKGEQEKRKIKAEKTKPFADDWPCPINSLWYSLFMFDPQLVKECSGDSFEMTCLEWARIIEQHPDFLSAVGRFMSTAVLYSFLSSLPENIPLCDLIDGWKKFTKANWCNMLSSDFVDRECFDWREREDPMFDEWEEDVEKKRKNLERYHQYIVSACTENYGWEDFNGEDWEKLLLNKKELSLKCDRYNGWKTLSKENWMYILGKNSGFVEKYIEVVGMSVDGQSESSDEKECEKKISLRRFCRRQSCLFAIDVAR